jgi:hypothetical protein
MKWPADKIERRPIAQLILYAAECAYKKNIPQKYFGWPSHKLFRARINYITGCDASGGRNDSFTAAIFHRERVFFTKRRSPYRGRHGREF